MEQYIVSARKYRPSTFDTVVGQDALTSTLKNAVATDRLAHAYLFCGSRGVGKTSCARIFAKTINCSNRTPQGEACNECDSCRQFNRNNSLNIIELDAASNNGVEAIKELIDQVMIPPASGRYRVFIIDEVHMLSQAAFNAFLKTLEEPPSYAIFILATTEKHKIIPTILSRCQIYDFNRITPQDMVNHMMKVAANEGITADPAGLAVIANKADGAMRDALSIFDQVAASSRGNITYQSVIDNLNVLDARYYNRLFDAILAQDVPAALLIYKEVRSKGFDSQFFINGLSLYMRDLMLAASPSTVPLMEMGEDEKKQLIERAAKVTPTFLYKAMDLCNEADYRYPAASNKQFLIELTLIKLCQLLSPSSDEESGSDEGLMPIGQSDFVPQAPQQQVQSAPAAAAPAAKVQPTTTAQRPAAAAPSASYSMGGLSLKNRKAATPATSTATASPAQEAPKRSRDFTEAEVASIWPHLTKKLENERLLYSILIAGKPEKIDGKAYKLMVTSTIQADAVNKALPQIYALMRQALGDDYFTLEPEILQGELPPQYWTEQQLLEHVVKENPGVAEMIAKFKMRLG